MTTTVRPGKAPGKTRPRRWPWLLGGALLLAVGGGLVLRQKQTASAVPPVTASTVTVQPGEVRVSVSGPGTLTAPNSMTVSTTQGGTVGTLPGVGDHVTRGQLLTTMTNDTVQNNLLTAQLNLQKAQAALDSTVTGNASSVATRQNALAQAQATQVQAQQALDDAQRTLAAQQKLLAVGAAPRNDVETAQSNFNRAQATLMTAQNSLQSARSQLQTGSQSDQQSVRNQQIAVQQAQLALKTAQQAVAQLKVYAPISGVVSSVAVTPGTNLNLSASGATLLTLLDDHTLYLPTQIDETEIGGVKVGQDAIVTLDALDGQTFAGKVITVSPSGTQSSGISIFTATVKLANPDGVLKSGMTAEAEILQSQQSGLMVPSKAIESVRTRSYVQVTQVDANGNPVGEPQRTRVQIGATDGTNTIVTDGLQAGQNVIVAGSKKSSAGTSGGNRQNNRRSGGMGAGGFRGPSGP